jgi:ABC-type glycerol-3-phosphate transport system substrate-binding protein
MDENVIFNKTGNEPESIPQQPVPPQSTPVAPVSQSVATPQAQPQVTPPLQGVSTPASLPKPPGVSQYMPIVKIAGIILAIILVIFLIFRFVLPLFGGEKAQEKVTLTYWGLWEDKQTMQPLIDEFQRANPTITVAYTKKDIKQYRESLSTQFSEGGGPDIFRFHNSWIGMLRGNLAPLTKEAVTAEVFKDTYFPVVQKDLIQNGGIYGIPLNFDSLSLFVNTELFEAAGTSVPNTWDQFVSVAKELTVKDSEGKIQTAGAAMGTYDNITHAPDIIALLMAQNGTDFDNFSKTTANASQALEFYTAFAETQGSVWDANLDPSLIAFAKGNLAMYFGYSWDILTIEELNRELKFTVHEVPSLPDREMSIASYWVEGVSNKSKFQKEAMLFMNFLSKRETAQQFYTETAKIRDFGELYPRGDLAATLQANPQIYPFVSQGGNAVSTYFVSDTYDDGLNTQMNTYLGNAVRGSEGSGSIETAIETLAQGVTQVLSKYGQ